MNVTDALDVRRSIKQFDPTHEVDDALLAKLLAPVLHTPTSFNLQHWRFIAVRDRELKRQLAAASYHQKQVADCSVVVMILGKLTAHEDAVRVWTGAPERVQASMVRQVASLYPPDATLQRDEAVRSGGLAAMALMLTAVEHGLGTCPLIGFEDAKVRVLLGVPDDHLCVLMLCVGRPAAPPFPRIGRFALSDVVRLEQFGGAAFHAPASSASVD
jgi:nitroreductase